MIVTVDVLIILQKTQIRTKVSHKICLTLCFTLSRQTINATHVRLCLQPPIRRVYRTSLCNKQNVTGPVGGCKVARDRVSHPRRHVVKRSRLLLVAFANYSSQAGGHA